MSPQVATSFTLEGVKYETGQLLDESFPADSVAAGLRTGRLVNLTEAESTAAKAEYRAAADARKKADEKKVAKQKADDNKAAKIKKADDEKSGK